MNKAFKISDSENKCSVRGATPRHPCEPSYSKRLRRYMRQMRKHTWCRVVHHGYRCWAIEKGWHCTLCHPCGEEMDVLLRELSECNMIRACLNEIYRLKRGDFTPEEFQNLCHNLDEKDCQAFCDGCDVYQRKLFGKCSSDKKDEVLQLARTYVNKTDPHCNDPDADTLSNAIDSVIKIRSK